MLTPILLAYSLILRYWVFCSVDYLEKTFPTWNLQRGGQDLELRGAVLIQRLPKVIPLLVLFLRRAKDLIGNKDLQITIYKCSGAYLFRLEVI